MMDKKSANGFQTQTGEGGVQRKQLPYSVETPYGFHLDLDFLKYVDDIEKGNTIKRVHIQRRVRGPPKFSTLPRNFSLPGHGIRPVPKEKDAAWSGTSTLGPKPKSRVTEVQQILDFRHSEGGTSSQGKIGQGSGFAKSRDEGGAGAQGVDEQNVWIQSRPNLLRASSMPITLQQRKGSDSSSPDRTVGTPENGSTENMFRASPEVTERRCVPQERTGLHQQITVALKRVRELEEQVKTIPELKAQISSLRSEREQLLLQLQAQAQAQVSTSSPRSDPEISAQSQRHRPKEGFNLNLKTQTSQGLPTSEPAAKKSLPGSETEVPTEKSKASHEEEALPKSAPSSTTHVGMESSKRQTQQGEKSSEQIQTATSQTEPTAQDFTPQTVPMKDAENTNIQIVKEANGGKLEDSGSTQSLHDKLMILETKLTQASEELERTNSLLKEQMAENKLKEERILQLREGMKVEVCTTEVYSRPRRESIDTGTETERVDYFNQETETELPGTVDQGTDTERICIEVCVPEPRSGSADQELAETSTVYTSDQVTKMEAEVDTASTLRPRANSMERGTVTERVATQDQTTETPVAERVNQVTETEGEMVTNHPQRPRASSVDRGTETERVNTVDRVTETEVAQRTDQHTETDVARQEENNPERNTDAASQVGEAVESASAVSGREEGKQANKSEPGDKENVDKEVVTRREVAAMESVAEQSVSPESVCKGEATTTPLVVAAVSIESEIEVSSTHNDPESKEDISSKGIVMEVVEEKPVSLVAEGGVTCAAVTESAVVVAESETVKTAAPVRPQRGRRPSAEQAQPSLPQPQVAPVRPQRGSSEIQVQNTQPLAATQPEAQHQAPSPQAEAVVQLSEPQAKQESQTPSQVEDISEVKRPPGKSREKQAQSKPQPQDPTPKQKEAQPRPKSIHPQAAASRRDSKEIKTPPKASSGSHPSGRGSADVQSGLVHQGSVEVQAQSRRSPSEIQTPQKDTNETPTIRRGSGEAAQTRGSGEPQASRRDAGEAQTLRRGSSESPTSPAALGQVVTRLTGLLGEQWAQLGSGSGAQQTASQQEIPSTQKQMAGKKAEALKGAAAKPAGKAAPTGKPAGKPGPSKMSSIQSQLVSSLSVLSAFYSPGQKSAAASKQQEQGLKSIMKKDGVTDKQANKGTKKNLKFVGVNGGYETTSSEESSGDEKPKAEAEEEDSSEPEDEKKEPQPPEKQEEGAEAPAAEEKESETDLLDPVGGQELLEEQADGDKVDKGFIDACLYVKDRMEEVSSPDKEMRQVLVVLYQEWFKVSSQRDSRADTVRLYLRQVGLTTPTLLPYVVNLTDGNGNMALHYSVSHSNFPVVKLLLDTGLCETDNVNKAGYTPVMLAALTPADSPDDLEVAQQLLRLGDVNARSRQTGQTALMLAVSHGRLAMVRLLLSCGADVNAQDREGSTALMCASEHGHTHIARLLLETGRCDAGLTDKNGQTARSVAEAASHSDIVDLLKAQASEPPAARR